MVQQLSLVGTVKQLDFNSIINSFIAITGQKPQLLSLENLIYKPAINLKRFENSQNFKTDLNLNSSDQYLVRITNIWSIYKKEYSKNVNLIVNEVLNSNDDTRKNDIPVDRLELFDATKIESGRDSVIKKDFNLNMSDIPSAGNKKISIQSIYEVNLKQITHKKLNNYLMDLGYVFKSHYYVKGVKFLYNRLINIEIFQIFQIEKNDNELKLSNIDKLNGSNWFVKIYINVDKLTDLKAINSATENLLTFEKNLRGLLDLTIPDRSCMDSSMTSNM